MKKTKQQGRQSTAASTSYSATDLEDLRSTVSRLLAAAGATTPATTRFFGRLDNVTRRIRLPRPDDRSCNKTPISPRWLQAPKTHLTKGDPRAASELGCNTIEAELLAQVAEFDGAVQLGREEVHLLRRVLGREAVPGSAACFISGDTLTIDGLLAAVKMTTNQVGAAELPVEYRTGLREGGRHAPGNLAWVRTPSDLITVRRVLATNGVPSALIAKVQLKAHATDKVTMPPHFSNRDYRWATWVESIQFASRTECQGVELELLSQILEFEGAPRLSKIDMKSIAVHFGKKIIPDSRKCPITGKKLVYSEFLAAVTTRAAGKSAYHVGHLVPLTRGGRHDRSNVVWMSEQGNRMQGNDTYDEIVNVIVAAAKFHGARANPTS